MAASLNRPSASGRGAAALIDVTLFATERDDVDTDVEVGFRYARKLIDQQQHVCPVRQVAGVELVVDVQGHAVLYTSPDKAC